MSIQLAATTLPDRHRTHTFRSRPSFEAFLTHQRFTISGDPVVERAIQGAVDSLVRAAREIPGVDAILLGGSLGRGEATHSAAQLESDIELYLVGTDRRLRRAAASLERIERDGGRDVSIAWIHPRQLIHARAKNLSWRPSITIRHYELATGSRVLDGTLPAIAPIEPQQLPLAEGVRLLLNRLAEAAPPLALVSASAPRWLDKLLIAAGDTLLLADGRYTVRYRDRMSELRSLGSGVLAPEQRDRVVAAYGRKLDGGGPSAPQSEAADIVESVLRFSLERTIGLPTTDWRTFPGIFAARAAVHRPFLRYLPPFGPAAVYEGFIVILRMKGAGMPVRSNALIDAMRGRPLSLLLQAAAAPLGLGILRARADLVEVAATAMEGAGIVVPAPGGPSRAADVATTLRRYWSVSS